MSLYLIIVYIIPLIHLFIICIIYNITSLFVYINVYTEVIQIICYILTTREVRCEDEDGS